jgi:phage tail protein X
MKRYQGIEEQRNINPIAGPLRALYYKTVQYPEIPPNPNDIYVITDWGDRLDKLSFQFYGDVTLYWVIAIANPNLVNFGSVYVNEGTQLRIPVEINEVLNSFKRLNGI